MSVDGLKKSHLYAIMIMGIYTAREKYGQNQRTLQHRYQGKPLI